MVPLRAPTMRSVPEIVSAKLCRAPVRTFSTPSSSMTLTAMASTVSERGERAVAQRLQRRGAGRSCRRLPARRRRRCRRGAATRSKRGAELLLVADHDDATRRPPRASANSRSRKACCRSRSSAEVGSSATISSGRADQRPRRGDALLLADAEARRPEAPRQLSGVEAEAARAAARASSSAGPLRVGPRRALRAQSSAAAARCRGPSRRAAG